MTGMARRREAETAPGQRRGRRAWPRAAAAAVALLLATFLAAQPAAAFCSKPVSPHCSADGTLDDSYVSTSRCKASTEKHVEALEIYRECLQDLVEETGKEIQQLKDLLGTEAPSPQA